MTPELRKDDGQKDAVNAQAVNGSAPRPLTREQRRQVERQTEKAMQKFNAFCERFADFIYDTDNLTDDMVKSFKQELNAKWRVYANQHRLNESSMSAFTEYCDKFYEAYKKELKGGEEAELKAG